MMRIGESIASAVKLVPALACLLISLWSCNGILSGAQAEIDGGSTACSVCPELVPVDAGSFLLGSPADEPGRVIDEGPQKRVEIAAFWVSRFEITVAEFRAFVDETRFDDDSGCYTMTEGGTWSFDADASWRAPGFTQEGDHPVVCITWAAANAYVDWLNGKVPGAPYRLLSESEWEYSARAGTQTPYGWGEIEDDFCQHTNGVDQTARSAYPGWALAGSCDDGFLYTAPVGSFASPNDFGIEDMVGNVWEWVADCYVDGYEAHPDDGSPVDKTACEKRVFRGGAWGDFGSFYLRTAYRGAWNGSEPFANIGFRVAAMHKIDGRERANDETGD